IAAHGSNRGAVQFLNSTPMSRQAVSILLEVAKPRSGAGVLPAGISPGETPLVGRALTPVKFGASTRRVNRQAAITSSWFVRLHETIPYATGRSSSRRKGTKSAFGTLQAPATNPFKWPRAGDS